MYLGVAVHAASTLGDGGTIPPTQTVGGRRLTGQRGLHWRMRRMARLAKERRPHLQHAFYGGAMRVMANRAVFTDRLVFMHERPALLHMAGVAGFIYAIALHEFGAD